MSKICFSNLDELSLKNMEYLGNEILIFAADISIFPTIQLPENEIKRGNSMLSESRRSVFFAGRRLIRGIISQFLNIPDIQVPLLINSNGKPYLDGINMPYLSLTHTQDQVILLLTGVPAGIDLERSRNINVLNLAKRFFTPKEVSWIESDDKNFFVFWVSREASIKADGRGIGYLLNKIDLIEYKKDFLILAVDQKIWSIIPIVLKDNYYIAIAFPYLPDIIHWYNFKESAFVIA